MSLKTVSPGKKHSYDWFFMKKDGKPDEKRKNAIGKPMFLAEARFLRDELRAKGISARIGSDRSLGQKRQAIHSIYVAPPDAESANELYLEQFPENEDKSNENTPINRQNHCPRPW